MLKIIAHSAAKVEKECWKLLNRHQLVSILRKYFSKNEEIILANIDMYKCNLWDVTFFSKNVIFNFWNRNKFD